MAQEQIHAGDEPLKQHGDKLAAAGGGRAHPAEAEDSRPTPQAPLKDQGDKLQAAVDKAAERR